MNVYWRTCETRQELLNFLSKITQKLPSHSPSADSCSVHMNFLRWPRSVTPADKDFLPVFLTLNLIWLPDQKYSGRKFLPDFSQESFHVARPPARSLIQFTVFPWHASWHVSLCGFSRCQDVEDGELTFRAKASTWRKKKTSEVQHQKVRVV